MSRTKSKAEETQSNVNEMHKVIYEDDPRFKGFFEKYEIGYENPAAFSLSSISKIIELTFDLKLKLLINNTKQDFITSDNPVIKYNQFLEKRKQHGGITGLGVKGVQYFLPIDAKRCLLFYDDITYKIGAYFNDRVLIKTKKEIDRLNLMQVLNCADNVYFNDNTCIDYIKVLHSQSIEFDKPGINKVDKYSQGFAKNGGEGFLIHSYITDLKIALELSFINETREAKKYEMGNKTVHVRNEKFNKLIYNKAMGKDSQ